MKKVKLFIPLLFMIALQTFAQTTDHSLVPYRSGDKWGFSDPQRNIVIQPKFDDVNWFSEGYAAVKKGSKWGYINKAGKLVIPAKFTVAKSFRKGFMPVGNDAGGDSVLFAGASLQADGYEICINTKGVRMPKCPAIPENSIVENNIPVKQVETKKTYSLPNSAGLFDRVVDDYSIEGSDETYYVAIKNGNYGVLNSKFETIVPFDYSEIKIYEGLGNPYLLVSKNGNHGFMSSLGDTLIEPQYSSLLPVQTTNGKGYVIVQKDGKYFVKDLADNDFIPLGFTDIFYDERGGFVVTADNNLKGFYFMDNKKIAAKYVDIQLIPGGDYLLVKTFNGKLGYLNSAGDEYFVE